jgi:glycosyltransferase involved in cell wall biosynthesis
MAPALAVVMPVRNALPFLDAAVESILSQTFSDFEFVILDASEDGSREALRGWAAKDSRIRLIEAQGPTGFARSSNEAVAAARAPLVARMDADDVAHPERLAHQIALMQAAPEAVLCGTLWDAIDADGRRIRAADRSRLLRRSPFPPFCHPTILFRKAAFDRIGGYREAANFWEDVDLYLRFAREGRVLVVPETLLSVRYSDASTRLRESRDRFEEAMDLMYRCAGEAAAGRDYTPVLTQKRPSTKIALPAFVTTGSPCVWTGERPGVFTRMVRRGRLGFDAASLFHLTWAAWADLSPKSLRAFLRLYLAWRNRRAGAALAGGGAVEWKPPSP